MKIKDFIMSVIFFALLTAGTIACYSINTNAHTYTIFIQILVHAFYIMMFILTLPAVFTYIALIGSNTIAVKIIAIILTLGAIAKVIIVIHKYKEFLQIVG